MQRPLAGLTRRNLVTEVTAGVTLLAIAIPLNNGYAQIAGLPAAQGVLAVRMAAPLFFANGTVSSAAVKRAVAAPGSTAPN